MSGNIIYLDNNATTEMLPEVVDAMVEASLFCWGNPSSIHQKGQEAKQRVTAARRRIASRLGCRPSEVIFTSGGTEAIHFLVRGIASRVVPGRIVTTSLEHACVGNLLATLGDDWSVDRLPTGEWGTVTPEALEGAITADTRMIVLMAANNETGVKLDLEGVSDVALRHGVPLVVDAVALFGKELFSIPDGVSGMAFSGHKIHGPKGVGFAYLKRGCKVLPSFVGGAQEFGRRAGTENVPGIAALANAVDLAYDALPTAQKEVGGLRDYFEESLRAQGVEILVNGCGPRLCNTSNLAFAGRNGETMLMKLDLEGVAVSHGSACSSGALEPSHVLLGMGYDHDRADASLRFSLSRFTTSDEIDRVVRLIKHL